MCIFECWSVKKSKWKCIEKGGSKNGGRLIDELQVNEFQNWIIWRNLGRRGVSTLAKCSWFSVRNYGRVWNIPSENAFISMEQWFPSVVLLILRQLRWTAPDERIHWMKWRACSAFWWKQGGWEPVQCQPMRKRNFFASVRGLVEPGAMCLMHLPLIRVSWARKRFIGHFSQPLGNSRTPVNYLEPISLLALLIGSSNCEIWIRLTLLTWGASERSHDEVHCCEEASID